MNPAEARKKYIYIFFYSLHHNWTALGSGRMFSFQQPCGDRAKTDLQHWTECAGVCRGTAKSLMCQTRAAQPCSCWVWSREGACSQVTLAKVSEDCLQSSVAQDNTVHSLGSLGHIHL